MTLVPELYYTKLYNGDDVHWRQQYFLTDGALFRVGSPRFRLAKVKKGEKQHVLELLATNNIM